MKRFIFLVVLFSSCYLNEELPPDQDVWNYDLPKNQGMNQDSLLAVNRLIESEEFGFIQGMIIIKNDELVYENYFNNLSRESIYPIGNAGLSITHAAVGIALDLRLFALEDSIIKFLPEYEDILLGNPNKAGITIENLLEHKSGIVWNESIGSPFSTNDNVTLMKESDDWIRYVLSQLSEAQPGLRYSFNSANGLLITKIIENASGQNFMEFLQQEILDPLKIRSLEIEQDPSGNYNGGDGYSLSLIEWTKIAYLYYQKGLWKGRRIIDPNFIEESISLKNEIQTNPSFGPNYEQIGYWWGLFGDQSQNRFGIPSNNIFYMYSREGNSIFINTEDEVIVAISAENFFSISQSLNLFTEVTRTIPN